MKKHLLHVLCCPTCRGELFPSPDRTEDGGEIQSGTLTCWSCRSSYPIRRGVPNMIPDSGSIGTTKRSFQYQWMKRFAGAAEPRALIFGHDVLDSAAWLGECATAGFSDAGGWLLDAGCGSADKTMALARLLPRHHVVGMDLSDSLMLSAAESTGVENLHFVQGDMMRPPFRRYTFKVAMSIAALHHTPDTRRAFESIARVVQPAGRFITYIYPAKDEYPASAFTLLYRQRDRHFLNQARRLPPALGMLWCRAYVAALFPSIARTLRQVQPFSTLIEKYELSRLEIYRSAVFFTFDNVMPEYQHRHSRQEVLSWYAACGFNRVTADYPGTFVGRADEAVAAAPAPRPRTAASSFRDRLARLDPSQAGDGRVGPRS